ncbi:MAG TPA: hypothetical protein VIU39_07470 [Anaerolineales bacterium]
MIGFHLAAPAVDLFDYDTDEASRSLLNVEIVPGTFLLKAKARLSRQVGSAPNLEVQHMTWLSVYGADISNLFRPDLPHVHAPALLVSTRQASFGI